MLPNLIVIGAMKAGTSSLHHYLSLHPEIAMSERKELNFFERAWDQGTDWYRAQFPDGTPVRGESSPNYTKFPRHGAEAPERMHSLLPDARLVYLVRDPIERIVSHYIDAYSFGRVSRPLADELRGPEGEHFVNTSRYFMQLSRYLEHFDRTQILLVASEELRESPRATLAAIFRFLGVDDSFWSPLYEVPLNTAGEKRRRNRLGYSVAGAARTVRRSRIRRYVPRSLARPLVTLTSAGARPIERPVLDDRVRGLLRARLEDDVAELRRFSGKPLADWSL